MKRIFTLLSVAMLSATSVVKAQDDIGGTPYSTLQQISHDNVAVVTTPIYDYSELIRQSAEREKQGTFPITDKLFEVAYNTYNSGTWIDLMNGDRMWRLKIKSPGAKKTSLYYRDFHLPEGGYLFVYNENKTQVLGAYSSRNNEAADENGGIFSTEYIVGETQIVEYYEPATQRGKGHVEIAYIVHQFIATSSILKDMMIDESDACEVDVNCSEGASWTDQKTGVVRLFVVMTPSSVAGWCSGTLVNNTAADCKKYILTAMHCAYNGSTETTNYNLWKAYWNYEKTAANCVTAGTGGASTSKVLTGSVKVAGANDGGGNTGSDFLLIRMTTVAWPSGVAPYYNGWTRATTAPTGGGVGIHHPAGDCKKISTFTVTPTTSSWGISGTHWQMSWAATTNGHGVTEGGSSGSALYNSAGLIFGTLTGGSSFCTALTSPDKYGKMSYHWTSNSSTDPLRQLKPWLDPTNSGVTTLTGSYSCTPTSGINDQESLENVIIYPNPNNGTFSVSIELPKADDVTITVFNVVGQQISAQKISNMTIGTYAVDLSDKVNGIYFVEVKTDKARAVKKINVVR